MKIFNELQRTIEILSRSNSTGQWAICGGIAASIYRSRPRFTDDINIALIDSDTVSAQELACRVIKDLGYREYQEFIPDPFVGGKQVLGLICARGTNDDRFIGVDFLLPSQVWVRDAVIEAQSNQIDFGFTKLPTITPESLIVAKVIALCSSPDRFQDLDDIKEILNSVEVRLSIINQRLSTSNLAMPQLIRDLLKM